MKKFMEYVKENDFEIRRNGEEKIKMPILLFGIVFILFWKLCSVLMLIGLFFNYEYSFTGITSDEGLNGFFENIEGIAQNIKKSFQ